MKKLLFILSVSGMLLCSCQNNDDPGEPDDGDTCVTFPEYWYNDITIQWQYRPYSFYAPAFNPNNGSEFIYVKLNQPNTSLLEVRKHNLDNQSDITIATVNYYSYKGAWASDGWIYFNNTAQDIWKVRDDGSSIQQITTGAFFNPRINPAGTLLLCENVTNQTRVVVLNTNGQILDTIENGNCTYGWLSDTSLMIVRADLTFIIYSYPSLAIIQQGSMDKQPPAFDVLSDSEIVYVTTGQVFCFNHETQTTTTILPHCGDSYNYFSHSVSPDKTTLLVERQFIDRVDSVANIYYRHQDIVSINLSDPTPVVVPIPQ